MGVVHQAYENPFPVSIATDRDADAPRGALGSPLVATGRAVNSRRMAEPNGRP
jgi:hypothetical protein